MLARWAPVGAKPLPALTPRPAAPDRPPATADFSPPATHRPGSSCQLPPALTQAQPPSIRSQTNSPRRATVSPDFPCGSRDTISRQDTRHLQKRRRHPHDSAQPVPPPIARPSNLAFTRNPITDCTAVPTQAPSAASHRPLFLPIEPTLDLATTHPLCPPPSHRPREVPIQCQASVPLAAGLPTAARHQRLPTPRTLKRPKRPP